MNNSAVIFRNKSVGQQSRFLDYFLDYYDVGKTDIICDFGVNWISQKFNRDWLYDYSINNDHVYFFSDSFLCTPEHIEFLEREYSDTTVVVKNDAVSGNNNRYSMDFFREGIENDLMYVKFKSKQLAEICEDLGPELTITSILSTLLADSSSYLVVSPKDQCGLITKDLRVGHILIGTKYQTLSRIAPALTKSRVLPLMAIYQNEWSDDRYRTLYNIRKYFSEDFLIIRSSSKNEDGWKSSNAGGNKSVLNVDRRKKEELEQSIVSVFDSYESSIEAEQVLVQPMMQNVAISGVAMTRTLSNLAPYYVINYDDTGNSTSSITDGSGKSHKTLIVYKNAENYYSSLNSKFSTLIYAIQEIEKILDIDALDIEFGIDTDGKVVIFQIRPITCTPDNGFSNYKLEQRILQSEKYIVDKNKSKPRLEGSSTVFGAMPDAHPAELIGVKPRPLSFSLYRYFITDEVVAHERTLYGYGDTQPYPLMVDIGGQPFVDVRVSLNSLTPSSLDSDLRERVINRCLGMLRDNQSLHDKMEFEVLITNWFAGVDSVLEDRFGCCLSESERQEFKKALVDITNDAIFTTPSRQNEAGVLDRQFKSVVNSDLSYLYKAYILMKDGKRFGAGGFVHTARSSFLSISILRSLVKMGLVKQDDFDQFMASLDSVTSKMEKDAFRVKNGLESFDSFVKEYGHLRPGTYDITVPAYFEDPDTFIKPIINQSEGHSVTSFRWPQTTIKEINSLFIKEGIVHNFSAFEYFCRSALTGRERWKFLYTRNMSYALYYLKMWAEDFGLSSDELSYLSWNCISDIANGYKDVSFLELREIISQEKERYLVTEAIEMPIVISSCEDVFSFTKVDLEANYITTKSANSEVYEIENSHSRYLVSDLSNKIVLIPRADPGFDWLFSYKISGLITMFGGGNSHMAIRSAEKGLPAAIGIGEQRYKQFKFAKRLHLDCAARTIKVL